VDIKLPNPFKLLITLFFCLLLSENKLSAQTRRALVIGISEYPKESGWHRINGSNDIEIIVRTLNQFGFQNRNIQILRNSEATKSAIVSGFENLIRTSQRGDIVYIHFSGHGQLITDLDGDEESGYDEAWIPYDAKRRFVRGVYEGENHLIDDQVNELLHRLRNVVGESGDILVVVDACHSGGSTRNIGDDEFIMRGAMDRFVIPLTERPARRPPNTTNWTTISASESFQSNFETRINGRWFGSLSYAIYSNRERISNADSYLFIFSILKGAVNNLVRFPQTPVIENGNRQNLIFVR